MRDELPSGTVTFLFTDVEGSTRLLHELGPERYADALAEHRRILRDAFTRHGGVEVDTQGDAFFVAFPTAPAALEAAAEALEGLSPGPIRVRVGIHTGTPHLAEEGYVGADVHRAARIAAAGHGGQVLVSASAGALLDGPALLDLGEHRFKDLAAPEHVYQLGDASFPPLKSLYRTNLPVPATPFLGRTRELREVIELLVRGDVRLLTLTGSGGTGKTRLAIQAAAEASETFPDGVTWVPLAPLRDASLVLSAVAQALEIKEEPEIPLAETLAGALAGTRALLLLDNVEHLLEDGAPELALLAATPGPVLLVTSRERLQLQGEHVYAVPTLEEGDGIELFLARARALDPGFRANGAIGELCSHLDHLPLALELAASRTVVFSPEQLLERLSQRLDLLKAGRDADPRQRTLRATIEWSHDLLDSHEQGLFRALSVFVGGCTYEAAEEICEADPDMLQSLLDKSLLRRRESASGPRYWMLETIREFAAERLEESGQADDLRQRHARRHARFAVELYPSLRDFSAETWAVFKEEQGNMRAALDFATQAGEPEIAGDLLYGLWFYWLSGGSGREAAEWAGRYLASGRERLSPLQRFAGDLAAAEILRFTGDAETAARLKRELVDVGRSRPDAVIHGSAITRLTAATLSDLVYMELDAGRAAEARACAEEALAIRRELGLPHGIAHALHAVSAIAYSEGDYERARELLVESAAHWEEAGSVEEVVSAQLAIAECDLLLGRLDESAALLREAIPRLREFPDELANVYALCVAAMLAESRGDPQRCAMLFGAADRKLEESGVTGFGYDEETQRGYLERAREELGSEAFGVAYEQGARAFDEVMAQLEAFLE